MKNFRSPWLDSAIRDTPCTAIFDEASGCTIWLKLEFMQPSGSTKDRVAAYILADGVKRGLITRDTIVMEASSGSTSIAFAMACAARGIKFCAVMPENVSRERLLMIRRFGGDVKLTPRAAGVLGALEETRRCASANPRVFLARQFENQLNAEAHEQSTGPELIRQVGVHIDGFVAGVGTAGTLMGIARALRSAGHKTKIRRVKPESGGTCFGGEPEICGGIPGVVDGLSTLLDEQEIQLDAEVMVSEMDALIEARTLCAQGYPVGPSSGLNVVAARRLARELGPGHHVATVLCDRMERYFSTELFSDVCGSC